SNHLVHEIAHRLKNQLALIGAVVRQSGRTADTVGTFSEHLEKRLQALGHSTTLLVASDWKHTRLRALIDAQLESFSGLGTITVAGPDV
ncbi:HWE histidine kinase domain-containing protein, partial [Acinetobacter baumannii]